MNVGMAKNGFFDCDFRERVVESSRYEVRGLVLHLRKTVVGFPTEQRETDLSHVKNWTKTKHKRDGLF